MDTSSLAPPQSLASAAAARPTVESCLAEFTRPEVLIGENRFACDSCQVCLLQMPVTCCIGLIASVLLPGIVPSHPRGTKLGGHSTNDPSHASPGFEATSETILSDWTVTCIFCHSFLSSSSNCGTCSSVEKNQEHVAFGEVLDVAPFLDPSLVQSHGHLRTQYRLYGVVVHSGSMSGGHYISYIRHLDLDAMRKQQQQHE